MAQALKEFPQMNSMWAGDKIVQKKDINISIAVATDDALFVPVIKHADEKSIKGIAREIAELAAKVRAGKLRPEDMQGAHLQSITQVRSVRCNRWESLTTRKQRFYKLNRS